MGSETAAAGHSPGGDGRGGCNAYARRRPEESVLYGVVQAELETFRARVEARDRPVPRFVERELRGFLRCGILAHGFVRVHCDDCGLDRVPDGALRFRPLPPPDNGEVERVVAQVAKRIARLLERRGLGPESDPAEADPLAEEQPLLAQLYGASVAGRIATGRRAGQRVVRVGDCIDPDDLPALEGERCASVSGVSLHANVAVPARDRRRLERLCRYVARPPVATERLSRLDDGRLLYRLKHRWRDGTTHVVFEPQELVEKLAALAPPPRFHLVRYHGILGPCASERDRVVPGCAAPAAGLKQGSPTLPLVESAPRPASTDAADERERAQLAAVALGPACTPDRPTPRPAVAGETVSSPGTHTPRPRRLAWSALLQRVFAVDVLECPRCGGRMRLLAAIHPPEATEAILECLDLSSRAPPTAGALPDPDEAGGGSVESDGNL